MLRCANDATPDTAGCVRVPAKVPVEGFVPMATVTLVVLSVVTRFPPASRTSTCTAGVMAAPGGVLDGCTRNPTSVADPTATVKALDVSPANPLDDAFRV